MFNLACPPFAIPTTMTHLDYRICNFSMRKKRNEEQRQVKCHATHTRHTTMQFFAMSIRCVICKLASFYILYFMMNSISCSSLLLCRLFQSTHVHINHTAFCIQRKKVNGHEWFNMQIFWLVCPLCHSWHVPGIFIYIAITNYTYVYICFCISHIYVE